MWSLGFWRDAVERAVKTAAQTVVGLLVAGVTVLNIDWGQAAAVTGTAALASILTSLISTGVGDHESPSLVDGGRWRRGERVE